MTSDHSSQVEYNISFHMDAK